MQIEPQRAMFKHALLPVVLLILIQCVVAYNQKTFDAGFSDPDSYTWLNRVTLLHDSGAWFDATNPRINPPLGHGNHWSRSFDALLLVGGWLGSPFYGFEASLYGWAMLLNLLLHVLALLALLWAMAPVMRDGEIDILGFLFVANIVIFNAYFIGRPDHQSLISLLFIVSIGCIARLLIYDYVPKWSYVAGALSALAVWVSIECILIVFAIQIGLGLFWLSGTRGYPKALFDYSISLLFFTLLFLVIQRGPQDLFTPAIDQISIVFVTLFTLITLFWLAVEKVDAIALRNGTWRGRLLVAGTGAALTAISMELLFPGFFGGPLAKLDALYRETRYHNIAEYKPAVDFTALFSKQWGTQLVQFSHWLGFAVPAIPVLVYKLLKKRDRELRFWIFLAVCLVVFFPLVFKSKHWLPYSAVLLLPLYAIFVFSLFRLVPQQAPPLVAAPLRIMILAVCAIGFLLPTLVWGDRSAAQGGCSLKAISPFLNDPVGLGERPKNLLAYVDFGPELLYRTKHSVYAYPNHRHQPGYTDSYHIFTAVDDNDARILIRQRKVELILVCTEGPETQFYARQDGRETLHHRLSEARAPEWLVDVTPPSELSAGFRIYRVQTSSN